MTYKKCYPANLHFEFKNENELHVTLMPKTEKAPDLWGIKYLFDEKKDLMDKQWKVFVEGEITNTMALRMYYLSKLFPNIEFHDCQNDNFKEKAETIIEKIKNKQYITYCSPKEFETRGTKDTCESRIEDYLSKNLSTHIPDDFSDEPEPIRQFPANVFNEEKSEKTRITDELRIDILAVNKRGELCPIELKVGKNSPFDLFAQGLDYGIYCYLFQQHIKKNFFECQEPQKPITIYYIGEDFHPALIGRNEEKGIISLVKKNGFFNIVFIKIEIKNSKIVSQQETFNSSKPCT